ncbi:probable WRKY transcription factor 26 [Phalaenopsis equestris]|uniref:probable WRKY transcription factor 26 n=1 Tax=Phalaenopsis equestris TaxID=78828 RepID=UPI0009E615D9|nr:probable WRKY transcription factor 26 [Phalaenopsis equestris]
MTPSSSSFVNSENSAPILSFSAASSSSNTFLRGAEAAMGEERSTSCSSFGLKSNSTPCLLFPSSAPLSPYSFLSLPGGLSPSMFLNSPMPLSSSNILDYQAIGSSFPAQTSNWRENSINNFQVEFKEHDKSNSSFSLQTSTWPANLQTSSFHPSSIEFISSEEEAFKIHQQSWSFQQQPLLSSNEIPTMQTSNQAEYSSNHSAKGFRERRKVEDGYNWRKYGQKQVKGSENPRSYYKCTNPNCPTRKKVERSLDGHIIEIIYKGNHNHSKPQCTRKNSSSFQGLDSSIHHKERDHSINGKFCVTKDSITTENSSASFGDEDIDMISQSLITGGDGYDENELDTKKWKMEGGDDGISYLGSRTVREPKVVVQTTSDIDILDDGYRWRKYGQKVVKGNPNPRSYYKCTTSGCSVRKHVERASTDLRAVITTYEGKHNHDVPISRGSIVLANKTLYENNRNKNNNNIYNMNNYIMPIKPSVVESRPGRMAYDSFFGTKSNELDGIGISKFDDSMNLLFAKSLQQQNQLQQLQQGQIMLTKAKEEPRDDFFIDSLLN